MIVGMCMAEGGWCPTPIGDRCGILRERGVISSAGPGTFQEFREYTPAVARGERIVDPSEPKV